MSHPIDLEAPLSGYYISRTEKVAYLPVVLSLERGKGHVAALLERLTAEHDRVVVPCVMNPRLASMLQRRGFSRETHWVEQYGEYDRDVWVWRKPEEPEP